MSLYLQPARVATDSSDTEGHLVFADGSLVAVLVRLSDDHDEDAGKWFLEAGFGRVEESAQPAFTDLETAQAWIQHRLEGGRA